MAIQHEVFDNNMHHSGNPGGSFITYALALVMKDPPEVRGLGLGVMTALSPYMLVGPKVYQSSLRTEQIYDGSVLGKGL